MPGTQLVLQLKEVNAPSWVPLCTGHTPNVPWWPAYARLKRARDHGERRGTGREQWV